MKDSVKIIYHHYLSELEKEVNSWLHTRTEVEVKSIRYAKEDGSHIAVIWYQS